MPSTSHRDCRCSALPTPQRSSASWAIRTPIARGDWRPHAGPGAAVLDRCRPLPVKLRQSSCSTARCGQEAGLH